MENHPQDPATKTLSRSGTSLISHLDEPLDPLVGLEGLMCYAPGWAQGSLT
jgi:hypothetical protein